MRESQMSSELCFICSCDQTPQDKSKTEDVLPPVSQNGCSSSHRAISSHNQGKDQAMLHRHVDPKVRIQSKLSKLSKLSDSCPTAVQMA